MPVTLGSLTLQPPRMAGKVFGYDRSGYAITL